MYENIWRVIKENKFEIENESHKLKCSICNELMIKACNAPCGCRFCSDCIENYLNENKFCPGNSKHCQKKMINYTNDIVIDNRANIQISEIIVKCPRKNCKFKDELSMIENHMRICEKRPLSCPYHEIGCEMNEVINDEMKNHLNEDNYCHSKLLIDLINNLQNEIESMKNEIIELRRENNKFKEKIDKIELQSTDQKICRLEEKERAKATEIEELNQKMVELKNENKSMKTEIIELRTENNKFKEKIDKIELQSTDEKEKICQLEGKERKKATEIEELNQKMVELKNENRSMKIEMQTNVKSINKIEERIKSNYKGHLEGINNVAMMKEKITKICEENAHFETELNNFDERLKEIIDGNGNNLPVMETILANLEIYGEFMWKFRDLSQQSVGTHIYSMPFFTWKFGYKICLRLSNLGLFRGCKTTGIYLHFMRGDFDDTLKWPFKCSVTIDVIDQQNGNIYQTQTHKYSDRPDYNAWSKPSCDMNEGIFYHYTQINPQTVRSDQILIKCKMDREK